MCIRDRVVTNDDALRERVMRVRGQGMDPTKRYWFPEVGYNYRLTNLQAAIGCGQLDRVNWLLRRHREVAIRYTAAFEGSEHIALPIEQRDCRNVYWLYSVRFLAAESDESLRDALMERLREDGIDTRPFFYPMHTMPVYESDQSFPVAECLAASGLNLPSSPNLTDADVDFIASRVLHHVSELAATACV